MNAMSLLARRGWFMPAAFLLGALLLSGWVSRLTVFLPYLAAIAVAAILIWTFLGTRGHAGDAPSPGALAVQTSASVAGFSRMKLGQQLDPQQFADLLRDGPPIGMPSWLARQLAVTLRAFLVSDAPPKPWSLLLASEEAWCLEEFDRRFCRALSLPAGRSPVRLECTTIMTFEREQIAKDITDSGVPLLIINSSERLRQHPRADIITSPLEVALQGRDPLLRDTVILVLEKGTPPALRAETNLSAVLREHRDAMKPITRVPVDVVGITCVLATLQARDERLIVLWEEFCRYAKAEFAVKIENARSLETSPDDSMWDFLGTALDEWDQHGLPAARAFIHLASQAALARARVGDVKSAKASWEPSSQRVSLKTT